MGGIGTDLANVIGAAVGIPGAGQIAAAFSPAAFGPITQNAQQIAAGVAPDVVAALTSQGYVFPPGTVGGAIQNPSIFDTFGGQNRKWVEAGAAALALLVVVKALKA